ncbi:MAG: hypothetical protein DI626_03945, partial [Micavibrio aeruginosavorus]
MKATFSAAVGDSDKKLIPNPMYLFSGHELGILKEIYMPESFCHDEGILVGHISLKPHDAFTRNSGKELSYRHKLISEMASWRDGREYNKIILMASVPSTLKIPHHILPDSSMIEQPGRTGALRTYFDGSSI